MLDGFHLFIGSHGTKIISFASAPLSLYLFPLSMNSNVMVDNAAKAATNSRNTKRTWRQSTRHFIIFSAKSRPWRKKKIEQSEKANSTNLNEVFSKLQEKTGDPLNKQNLTSEVLADTIMEVVTKPFDMPQENVEKMRDGILAALDFFKDYGKEDESKAEEESAS